MMSHRENERENDMKYLAKGMARVSAVALVASVLVVGVPGSANAAAYIKFGDIKGESTDKAHASHKPHKGEIEILSWSWGASQASTQGTHTDGGGGGAGKVSMAEAHAPKPRRGKVEATWKVEEGTKAASAPGEAEITLKRGAPAEAKSGVAPVRLAPASRDAGSLTTIVPAGMCRAGTRYETVELGTGEQLYRMEDVLVTACAPRTASQDDRPMESISFNYTKIEF